VSFSQAITALDRAGRRDGRFLVRLWRVVRRFDEDATARRIGYVVDRLFGADAAEPFRSLIGERRAPVRLRTTGRDQGPVDPLWRVIVNASTTPEPQGSQ
jgi:predicted transcriptional regulator of viral defense system